jgi:4-oxalocrotonate tautomerase
VVALAFWHGYRMTTPGSRASTRRAEAAREDDMPEVYVYAVEGRSIEQKRSLVKDITDAVVKNFKVPADAVMVQIMEAAKDTKAKGGVLFSDRPPA